MSAETHVDGPPADELDLTVIIAAYNAADTIQYQLDALTRQRFMGNWEVLICDNGSADATRDIAAAYVARRPEMRLVDASSRRGAAHARNVGARLARGRMLAFCDADDVVEDSWLQAIFDALAEHQFVAGRFGARLLNEDWVLEARPLDQQDSLQIMRAAPHIPHAGAGNMGVHRELFGAVGGFDSALTCLEDTDLCWRVQLSGVPLVFVREAVVHVRGRSRLSDLWRQGFNYGRAAAWLEHRYNGQGTPASEPIQPVRHRRLKLLAHLLSVWSKGRLGYSLWQAGWHIGHRVGHRQAARRTP